MRITFDARYIRTDESKVRPDGGIGRYSYQLLRHLLKLDSNLDLQLIVPSANKRPIFANLKVKISEVKFKSGANSFATQYRLANVVNFEGRDVFHSPFNMMPLNLPCPSVITIHDMMWVEQPALCAGFWPERIAVGMLYKIGIRGGLRKANHIITISNASKNAIERYDSSTSGRITVTHHGMEPLFRDISREKSAKKLGSLVPPGTKFVLTVGQGSPYKNQKRAIRAFLQAFADQPEVKLVVVRRFKRFDWETYRLLKQKHVRRRLILLPIVTDEELLSLYNSAHIFLFPSLVEGFGMPQLEAMACGTPVLTSSTGALAEISGNAALTVNPYRVDDIASGLIRLDRDEKLRARLVMAGKQRVKSFQWEISAKKTLDVYENILKTQKNTLISKV